MLLVLVKGLVLVSGSHGERCLPLAGMLLILILLCELPRDAMHFLGLPKLGKARRALAFKPTRHHASDYICRQVFPRRRLTAAPGCQPARFTAFASGYKVVLPAEKSAAPPCL